MLSNTDQLAVYWILDCETVNLPFFGKKLVCVCRIKALATEILFTKPHRLLELISILVLLSKNTNCHYYRSFFSFLSTGDYLF